MDEKGIVRKAWLILKLAAAYLLAILAIVALGRIVELYDSLSRVHPVLGVLFLVLLIAPLVYLGWQIFVLWQRVPAAVRPPTLEVYRHSPARYARKSLGFAKLVAGNLNLNPNLTEEERSALGRVIQKIEQHISDHDMIEPEDLQRIWEEETAAIASRLDQIAEKIIARSALFTSLGTAASRNSSLDGLIQVYQMAALTVSIIRVYWTRPGLVISLGLAKDILAAAGAVILVSEITTGTYFKRLTGLLNRLGDRVPGINILTGFLDEGVQAGVSWQLVRRYGKMVMRRCRAIEWNSSRERELLAEAARAAGTATKPRDMARLRSDVFELLRHFSWLGGAQDPQVALAMFDYVRETVGDRHEQLELFAKLRQPPLKEESLVQKLMFWKKPAHQFEETSPEAVQEFLALVASIRAAGLTPAEEQFVQDLQAGQPQSAG